MGILDDAIREHLDLKRRQGADQEEIARLEDEAFGPPTRPGDKASAAAEGEQGAPEGDAATATEGEAATATEVPAFHDQGAGEEPESLEAELDEEPAISGSPAVAEEPDAGDEGLATSDDATIPAEPTVEHDTLGEESPSEEIDLDIELQLDEEIEDAELDLEGEEEGPETGELAAPPASAGDEPVESLDTVEHHFEDALDEADVVEDDSEALADADEDEDVLEETPEFLRDAPEDDELWFEQGEPKDFDF